MKLAVLDYISTQSVHFSQLCDREQGGMPLFYPTLYSGQCLWRLRHGTQRNTLISIQRLYEWAQSCGLDLEDRLEKRLPLTAPEVNRLGGYLIRHPTLPKQSISAAKFNTRCAHVQAYLDWLASLLIQNSNDQIALSIEAMSKAISKLQVPPGSKHQRNRERLAKHLSEETAEVLFRLFQSPHAHVERSAYEHAATRNAVMLEILYETGMRLGELLSLKLRDFTPARGGDHAALEIRLNHDDPLDRRLRQPVAKTLGRIVPISEQLSKKIQDYLRINRASTPLAAFGDENFIFINHRANSSQGQPLEISAFHNALVALRKKYPLLGTLHPHLLRHDWNYRFSKEAQLRGLNETQEASERCYLMGWKPGSNTANLYNERHVIESAAQTGLQTANYVSDRRTRRS